MESISDTFLKALKLEVEGFSLYPLALVTQAVELIETRHSGANDYGIEIQPSADPGFGLRGNVSVHRKNPITAASVIGYSVYQTAFRPDTFDLDQGTCSFTCGQ